MENQGRTVRESYSYARNEYGTRRNTYERSAYIHGNTVRQLEEPQRERRQQPRRSPKSYPSQRPVEMPSLTIGSFAFLICAVVITLGFCFNYLRTQSQLTQMKNQVVTLQTNVSNQKTENQQEYENIVDSVDLANVYNIATGKLGMVQATKKQILTYNNKKSDMVKQYAEIPSAK